MARRATHVLPAALLVAALAAAACTSSPATTTSPASSHRPSATAAPVPLDQLAAEAVPATAAVLLHADGHGSTQLATVTPTGTIDIEVVCQGPGTFDVHSSDGRVGAVFEPCDGRSVGGAGVPGDRSDLPKFVNKPLTLQVVADPSTRWAIYIASEPA